MRWTIKKIIQWNDSDSVSATHEVVRLGTEDEIEILYLDPIGVGDGAVGTLRQNPPPLFQYNPCVGSIILGDCDA